MNGCPRCSTAIAPGASVCPACGAPVADSAPTMAGDATVASPSPGPIGSREARFVPGQMIAERYRVVGLLGRGGMGEVYRADDLKLGQPVALKFLPPGLEQDPSRLQRFLEEVRLARQVTHSHVCRVYDVAEFEGQHFLSMEYVDGEDLAGLLRRVGRLPQERAVEVARQICGGVAAAHDQGILHRDLKPANIMLDGRGQVRITDFGLAGVAETLGVEDATVGTPAYMAPEQLSGQAASIQSDLYALGLVLYEVYTGSPAFESAAARLRRDPSSSTIATPSSRVENLDPAVERAILHCLEPDPTDRPPSALSVAVALPGGDPLAAALAAGETPSPELVAASGRSESLSAARAWSLAALAVVVFLIGVHWAGAQSMFAYLPLDSPPEVLADHAQGLLRDAGYTEPAYAEPADRAWGFFYSARRINQAHSDSTADPWEPLRGQPDGMLFWYRQSPRGYRPAANTPNSFASGIVRLRQPAQRVAGETAIILDQTRRLKQFEVVPKRYSTRDPDGDVDWSLFFDAAGVDRTRAEPVRPRYSPRYDTQRQWAWIVPSGVDTVRVEAATYEGRPVFFAADDPDVMEALGRDPTPDRSVFWNNFRFWTDVGMWMLVVAGALVARHNWRRGRVDRRGAFRLGIGYLTLVLGFELLRSHTLFAGPATTLFDAWRIVGTALFFATVAGTLYLAVEPFGRQTWPKMFVSSSRLLSRPQLQWRDPLIGRAVLAGLLVGVGVFVYVWAFIRQLAPHLGLDWWWPIAPDVDRLISQRQAIAWVFWNPVQAVAGSLFLALLLAAWRRITRRVVPSLILTAVFWVMIFDPGNQWTMLGLRLVPPLAFAVLLTRHGLVALAVAMTVGSLGGYAVTDDWSAWYSQSAIACLVLVVALAVAGVVAATSPGRRVAEAP